ncbi:MAG: ubiquinone biosynthesis protein UbiA [Chitinophagaceae bacterium]|nr:MAG: ubiquinone biosynthesis protein UbiA [Chitinophagaceae bacterium]
MKLIVAFFRLIRTINLGFIVLTQFLFQYCIVVPVFNQYSIIPRLNHLHFSILVLASVCIAAAGYVINDYFDLNIDRINKPEKLVVEKLISRRSAILWHLGLSAIGVMLSFYVGWKVNNILVGFGNLACVVLLWVYSTTFKKKLLIGNIIISLLTAWVVLVLYFIEIPRQPFAPIEPGLLRAVNRVFRLGVLYGGFAFIISLIREVIKDIEDMQGDSRYGCRTMPIVWGVNSSKVFIATWLIVLICVLLIIQVYVFPFRWYLLMIYCVFLIIVPLLYVFRQLFEAQVPAQFHKLSKLVKLCMATGIISMVLFKLYF